jgi:hypothetical protein
MIQQAIESTLFDTTREWLVEPRKLFEEICDPCSSGLEGQLPFAESMDYFCNDMEASELHCLSQLGNLHTLIHDLGRAKRFADLDLRLSYGRRMLENASRDAEHPLTLDYAAFAGMSVKFITRPTRLFLQDVDLAIVEAGIRPEQIQELESCHGGFFDTKHRDRQELDFEIVKPIHEALREKGYCHRELVM